MFLNSWTTDAAGRVRSAMMRQVTLDGTRRYETGADTLFLRSASPGRLATVGADGTTVHTFHGAARHTAALAGAARARARRRAARDADAARRCSTSATRTRLQTPVGSFPLARRRRDRPRRGERGRRLRDRPHDLRARARRPGRPRSSRARRGRGASSRSTPPPSSTPARRRSTSCRSAPSAPPSRNCVSWAARRLDSDAYGTQRHTHPRGRHRPRADRGDAARPRGNRCRVRMGRPPRRRRRHGAVRDAAPRGDPRLDQGRTGSR